MRKLILACLVFKGILHIGAMAQPVIRELEPAVDHNHCTTRQFQHMSFQHKGAWFVFYSDGRDFRYQTSVNGGKTWSRDAMPVDAAPNGSTSFDVLKVGDEVFISHVLYPLGRYDPTAPYAKDPSRRGEYRSEGRIKRGRIVGRAIHWLEDVNPGFVPDYGNLVRDSDGYFWVFTRDAGLGVAHRSQAPGDISRWNPKVVCLRAEGRHAMDAAALDQGRLYVASVLTTGGQLIGNLFDGKSWRQGTTALSNDMTTVAGDDRRAALKFDKSNQRLHLIYVDSGNNLRHRSLRAPYGDSDWSPELSQPGRRLVGDAFTCALSLDTSRSSHGLVLTYGLQRHAGRDRRERTGEIHVRRFDGLEDLGRPLQVSGPGTKLNWYPNVNGDASNGLCVMYSRSVDASSLQKPLSVMASIVQQLP